MLERRRVEIQLADRVYEWLEEISRIRGFPVDYIVNQFLSLLMEFYYGARADSETFCKIVSGEDLEEVAEEYLERLKIRGEGAEGCESAVRGFVEYLRDFIRGERLAEDLESCFNNRGVKDRRAVKVSRHFLRFIRGKGLRLSNASEYLEDFLEHYGKTYRAGEATLLKYRNYLVIFLDCLRDQRDRGDKL